MPLPKHMRELVKADWPVSARRLDTLPPRRSSASKHYTPTPTRAHARTHTHSWEGNAARGTSNVSKRQRPARRKKKMRPPGEKIGLIGTRNYVAKKVLCRLWGCTDPRCLLFCPLLHSTDYSKVYRSCSKARAENNGNKKKTRSRDYKNNGVYQRAGLWSHVSIMQAT